MNFPAECPWHGLYERVAEEAAKSWFDEAVASIERITGAQIAKRQVEQALVRAAEGFHASYEARTAAEEPDATGSILVVSIDGRGVVTRQEELRERTRQAAVSGYSKLQKHRSKGEKSSSKWMATVAAA